jgi:hypothetical protein
MKKIEIKLIEPTTEKLKLVKLIKDCSGMGLKESKELLDNLHRFPDRSLEMPIQESNKTRFIEELQLITGKFSITGGKEWTRDIKLMQLGMSDADSIITTLSEYILNKWSDSKEILEEALSKLDHSQLVEVVSRIKLEKEIKGREENLPF